MSHPPVPAWRLETHAVLGSSNDRAIEAVESGAAPGLAVLALRQTAGRGRRGRPWHSLAGNLHLSVVLAGERAHQGGTLALAAGIAMHAAVSPLLPPRVTLRLKYPNDLLADGAKLGGVLVERGGPPRNPAWAVVGIGLNLATHPEVPERRTVSLAALGARAPRPEEAARSVLEALAAALTLAKTEGAEAVRAAWMARSFAAGTEMSVATGQGVVAGAYRGLDESGAMLLDVGHALHRIVHGDVMVTG